MMQTRRTHHIIRAIFILAMTMLTACSHGVKDPKPAHRLPDIYPDYIGVTIPAGIAPLDFNMTDHRVNRMDVVVRGSKGGHLHVNDAWARFDIDDWHQLTEQNRGGKLTVTVCAERNGEWTQYRDFDIMVSTDRLDDWGLTYRRIAPGYEVGGNIGIYQRDIHTFHEYPILTETAVPGRCMNCHTANRTDPSLFTTQIRGEGGGTLIQRNGRQEWLDTKTDSTKAAGSYAYWHPSGNYCAYATNGVFQAFFVGTGQRIEVYHTFSNIVVLDARTNELLLTPFLQTEDLEIFPAFSADGTRLFYSSSKPCRVPAEYERVKCSLCSIAFNAANGTFGTQADTLLNGPADDMSYTLARPSYDGRWLMYCQSSRSNFPVAQTDGDLCLMDLRTGGHRVLGEANSPQTESYHNWSSNSRWFVFSSKREDGMYARLFIAHLDNEGKATKPFLLPQRNPKKFYSEMMDSYNVPDFTKARVDFDTQEAIRQVMSNKRTKVKIKQH